MTYFDAKQEVTSLPSANVTRKDCKNWISLTSRSLRERGREKKRKRQQISIIIIIIIIIIITITIKDRVMGGSLLTDCPLSFKKDERWSLTV